MYDTAALVRTILANFRHTPAFLQNVSRIAKILLRNGCIPAAALRYVGKIIAAALGNISVIPITSLIYHRGIFCTYLTNNA